MTPKLLTSASQILNSTLKLQPEVFSIISINQSTNSPQELPLLPVTRRPDVKIDIQSLHVIIGLQNQTARKVERGASSNIKERGQTSIKKRGVDRLKGNLISHHGRMPRDASDTEGEITGLFPGEKDKNGTLIKLNLKKYLQFGRYNNVKGKSLCEMVLIDPALKNQIGMAKEVCKIIFSFAEGNMQGKVDADAKNITNKLIETILKEVKNPRYKHKIIPEVVTEGPGYDYFRLLCDGYSRFEVFFFSVGFAGLLIFIPGSIAFVCSMTKLRQAMATQEKEMTNIRKDARKSVLERTERLGREAESADQRRLALESVAQERIPLLPVVDSLPEGIEAQEPDDELTDILKSIFAVMDKKLSENHRKEKIENKNDFFVFEGELDPDALESAFNNEDIWPDETLEVEDESKENKYSNDFNQEIKALGAALSNEGQGDELIMSKDDFAAYTKPINAPEMIDDANKYIEYRDFVLNENSPAVGYFLGITKPPAYRKEAEQVVSKKPPEEPKFKPLQDDIVQKDKTKIIAAQEKLLNVWRADLGEYNAKIKEQENTLTEEIIYITERNRKLIILRSVIPKDITKETQEGLHNICMGYHQYNKEKIIQTKERKEERYYLSAAPDLLDHRNKHREEDLEVCTFGDLLYKIPNDTRDLALFLATNQTEIKNTESFIKIYQEAVQSLMKEEEDFHDDALFMASKYTHEIDRFPPRTVCALQKSNQVLRAYADYPRRLTVYQDNFEKAINTLKARLMINLPIAQQTQFSHIAQRSVMQGSLLSFHLHHAKHMSEDLEEAASEVTQSLIKSLGLDSLSDNASLLSKEGANQLVEKQVESIEKAVMALAHKSLHQPMRDIDYAAMVHGTLKKLHLQNKALTDGWPKCPPLFEEEERQAITRYLKEEIHETLEKRLKPIFEIVTNLIDDLKVEVAKAFSKHLALHLKGAASEVAKEIIGDTVRAVLATSLSEQRLLELTQERKAEKAQKARAEVSKKLHIPKKHAQDAEAIAKKALELERELTAHQAKVPSMFKVNRERHKTQQEKLIMKTGAVIKLTQADTLRLAKEKVEKEVLLPLRGSVFDGEQGTGAYEALIKRRNNLSSNH